mgnify:CR=1 FL=1|jgi:DNA-binding transcriptional ArsR family regulator
MKKVLTVEYGFNYNMLRVEQTFNYIKEEGMSKNEFICDCNIIHEKTVNETIKKMPEEDTFNKIAEFFKILGDTTRTKILFALDLNEMCVCDIANVLNMSKSSISHQLGTLRRMNIVKCRKEGKEVYYTLDDNHIKEVFEVALEHIEHKK